MAEALQSRVAGQVWRRATELILVSDVLPAMGCSPLKGGGWATYMG